MPEVRPRFINAPAPKESLSNRTRESAPGNPVLSGWLLAVLSRLLAASTWLQKVLWKLNKFDQLKNLRELEGYSARYDGTVIPVNDKHDEPLPLLELPKPRNRRNANSYYTVADYHNEYLSHDLTPLDVTEYLLSLVTRVGKTSSKYSVAYLDVQPDIVRAAARASTERYKSGQPLSMLDGIPIAVKDEVNLKGHQRSLGSNLNFKDKLDATDWCVRKWEEAGAIIIGKTSMHELGLDTTNNNPTWGTPLNPHNENYYTGGSSGGSACTVTQGICPIALGVDGGGSIRIPSSCCGLYGLKPSQNRVSCYPAQDSPNTLAVCGPMSPSIDDLALAFRIMAQPCPDDPVNLLFPLSNSLEALKESATDKMYLGIDRDWVKLADPDVLDRFNAAVQYYVQIHGYETVDIKIPLQSENQKAFSLTILAETMSVLKPGQMSELQHANQLVLNVSGVHATAQDLIACARLRERAMRHLSWLWTQYPGMLLLTPTMPFAGLKVRKPSDVTDGYGAADPDTELRSMEFTCFGNWVGAPAITCPVGYTKDSLPIGIMALGEWGSEEQLIQFARKHEGFLEAEGVRRPMRDGNWIDVLAQAKKM
ncbi:hypothetical protein LTR05_001440 [Lithohypha guttulata]|uniref:Amidase domain-containing protein n=1 Tax=Lithohypha guttulata TaxID=1690604 RepID=A0AAN7TEC0_9EURO|nr:hypothetical protein LTR05_001440 [Lithohypha guttulata]